MSAGSDVETFTIFSPHCAIRMNKNDHPINNFPYELFDQICYHITLIQFIIFFDADFHHSIIFYSFVLFEKKNIFKFRSIFSVV